jgi:2-C-methyl-D-erythritol 4-phosphate cytidylyltransferase
VAAFLMHPEIDEIVVALPADLAADPPPYLRGTAKTVRVVAGGARRQDSVFNAFQAVNADTDVVVIHDAARPFASAGLISRTIAAAIESGAALAAIPARDTVKRAGPANDEGAARRCDLSAKRCRAKRSIWRRRPRPSAARYSARRSRSRPREAGT